MVWLSDRDETGTNGAVCQPLSTVTEIARDIYYVTKTIANLKKILGPVP